MLIMRSVVFFELKIKTLQKKKVGFSGGR